MMSINYFLYDVPLANAACRSRNIDSYGNLHASAYNADQTSGRLTFFANFHLILRCTISKNFNYIRLVEIEI